ncbi:MATE family efflux transporter [Rummeliibacillus stabekisii]|uniref:MATE family efflux transporter n=1 Tax=Rummeliibacillus stabekisii TaxID=241244 RepID=UPI00116A867C|nr:MATE family efflux transporter [Rummeliibacillus stabekisii]MBB5169222.1 putative MATE family efflux protein [Rummeliibacillus stabekisii]GEL03483.1 MATE family efflux transporter [Rummeliibacillus stabekisii]
MSDTSIKLTQTPIHKLFLSYLFPSLLGMILMSVNILVDGIFVSNGVGPLALAGVNIAVPIFSILLSISLWIGMGGATLYSIEMGKDNIQQARSIFMQSLLMTVSIVGVLVIICLWKQKEIALLFGASTKVLPYVEDYLHVILLFGLIYVLENVLSIFIRNDGNPKLAMIGLITTSVLNIILNYIFIFQMNMGVSGAAYATALSTVVGLCVLLLHFLRSDSHLRFNLKTFHFNFSNMKEILKIGSPSFITEGSTAIVVVGYNIAFSHFVGEIGVTSYAVINYLHAVFIMLFFGISAAIQPIVSFSYGAKLTERLKAVLKLGLLAGIIAGILIILVGWLLDDQLIQAFSVHDPAIIEFTKQGIHLFFIGYLFLSYNLLYAEFYQSIKKIRLSMIIILMRSLVLFLPLLYLLPAAFSGKVLWLAFPIAEGMTAIGILLYQLKNNQS